MLKNIKIKTKLILIAIIVLCGFASSFLLTGNILKHSALLRKERDLSNLIYKYESKMDKHLLEARRREKDFRLSPDKKYALEAENHINEILTICNKIKELPINSELKEKIELSQSNLKSYMENFKNYVELEEKIGFNEETGLRGALRQKIHEVEEVLEKEKNDTLLIQMLTLRRNEKDFIIRKDEKYVKSFNSNSEIFLSKNKNKKIEKLFNEYNKNFNLLAQSEIESKIKIKIFTKSIHNLEPIFQELETYVERDADQKNNELIQNELKLKKTILIVNISVFIFVVIFILAVSSSITKPVGELLKNLENISKGEGDLTLRLNADSKDELGVLSGYFNDFVENINHIMLDIKKLVDKVTFENHALLKNIDNIIMGKDSKYALEMENGISEGIKQLNNHVEKVLDNVRNQSAGAEQSLAGLEEINATGENTKKNIANIAVNAKKIMDISGNNHEQMEKLTKELNSIDKNAEKTESQINQLVSLSKEIDIILSSIQDLSDQTALLSLNAAIESARAGEAGKGFAVVAYEIKKLAEKTNVETERIESIVRSIQNEVILVKNANGNTLYSVGNTIKINKSVLEAIGESLDLINQNESDMNHINNSLLEQLMATEEITSAVATISENSIEIESEAVKNSEISNKIKFVLESRLDKVKEINRLSSQLSDKVSNFKTT